MSSPPPSQSHDQDTDMPDLHTPMEEENKSFGYPTPSKNDQSGFTSNFGGYGKGAPGNHAGEGKENGNENGQGKAKTGDDSFGEPGSSWNNKAAKADYDREYAKLKDQDWNMRSFGDVLLRGNQSQNK